MNLKKMIDYDDLKCFFESKGFTVKSEFGAIIFTSPSGVNFGISLDPVKKEMIYLDCNLLYTAGLPNFPREWTEGKNLHDFLINNAYPLVRNICGASTMDGKKELVPEIIIKYLNEKNVKSEFLSPAPVKYVAVSPHRELYENIIEYKLVSFYKDSVKYGIILKQFNSIYLARFKGDGETVFYEHPWFSFCPIYKAGEDYIKTTIDNFLDFISRDKVSE